MLKPKPLPPKPAPRVPGPREKVVTPEARKTPMHPKHPKYATLAKTAGPSGPMAGLQAPVNDNIKKNTWQVGQSANPAGALPGKRLLTRVKELLAELSKIRSKNPDGTPNTRFDDAADAFVQKMEEGSFIHLKEYIDREEGKVPTRHADADGKNLKLYVGMPVEDTDPDAP